MSYEPGSDGCSPGRTRRLAFPTDCHGVFADPYAWELALEVIHGFQPDTIIWGSDAMDFGTISKHSKHMRLPSIQEELDDEQKRRAELKAAAAGATLWWLQDNHTTSRYYKYLWAKAPELAEVKKLAFEEIIDFPAHRVISEYHAGKTLRVIHGATVRKWPGWSVLDEIQQPDNRRGRMVHSVICGHVHRFAHVALADGVEGLECGCLMNLCPNYMRDARRRTDWCHGMGLALFGEDWSEIIPVRFFVKGDYLTCRVMGQRHQVRLGKDYSGL